MKANYRKLNDQSLRTATFYTKDVIAVRAILKREIQKAVQLLQIC
jgi:hypothetical protein